MSKPLRKRKRDDKTSWIPRINDKYLMSRPRFEQWFSDLNKIINESIETHFNALCSNSESGEPPRARICDRIEELLQVSYHRRNIWDDAHSFLMERNRTNDDFKRQLVQKFVLQCGTTVFYDTTFAHFSVEFNFSNPGAYTEEGAEYPFDRSETSTIDAIEDCYGGESSFDVTILYQNNVMCRIAFSQTYDLDRNDEDFSVSNMKETTEISITNWHFGETDRYVMKRTKHGAELQTALDALCDIIYGHGIICQLERQIPVTDGSTGELLYTIDMKPEHFYY
jgi:hypothetical protein